MVFEVGSRRGLLLASNEDGHQHDDEDDTTHWAIDAPPS